MSILRSYRLMRFTLLLLAILSQCVALGSFSLLVITGTLTAISWYITEGPRGRSIPPWISRLLVLVVVMFSAVDAYGPVEEMPVVLGRFVIWLTVIKMYSKRTIENEAQLLLLSLLLMAVGGLYATDLLFGVLTLLWFGLAAWVMLLFQLNHGCELMRLERYSAVPVDHGTPWTRPITGSNARTVFRKTAIVLLCILGVTSVLFFVAIPREQVPSYLAESVSHVDDSDRMELKPNRDLQPSNLQVMSVTLQSSDGESVQLARGLRLRGNVLDSYKGDGIWETSNRFPSSINTNDQSMTTIGIGNIRESSLYMHVEFHQPMKRVYSLYQPIAIETVPPTRVVLNVSNGTLGLGTGSRQIQTYTIATNLEPLVTSPMSNQEFVYENPEVHALTTRLLEEVMIDPATISFGSEIEKDRAANAIVRYLRSPEFTYATDSSAFTMSQRIAMEQDDDPIASFLLDRKRGHCEFFAAAMVGMCDTVGLQARIVTGYYADRWDNVNKLYVVLDRDAHAWVEVEVVPFGWATFDPTPSSEGAPTWQEPMSFAESIRFSWQRWEMAWRANIIGFDASAQQQLFSIAKPYWEGTIPVWWKVAKDQGAKVAGWFQIGAGGKLWINLVLISIGLSSVAMCIFVLRRKRTRKSLRLSPVVEKSVPTLSVEFYARFQHILRRLGFERPLHVPAMQWIQTLPLEEGAVTVALELTSSYYEIRFGEARPSSQDRSSMLRSVKEFEEMMQKGIQ